MTNYEIMNQGRMIAFDTSACAPSSEALVDSVVSIIQAAERRKRGRKANDLNSFKRAVDYILGDLFKAYKGESSPYAYRAEGKTNFVGSPVGHSTWKAIMPVLVELGYLEYFKGTNHKSFDEGSYLSGEASRFLATDSLISLAESQGINFDTLSEYYVTRMPKIVLKLRASKKWKVKGKELPITESPKTEALSTQVHRINKYLSLQSLSGGSFEGYQRTFNNGDRPNFDWNQGGRLSAVGGGYQQLSGERRGLMLINGEPVVEIDVSASHLSIYVGLMGDNVSTGVDLYNVPDIARAVVKQYVTISLGKGKLLTKWLEGNDDSVEIDEVKQAVCKTIPCFESLGQSGHDWATLQYLEAEAVIEAIESLHKKDIPAYGVHDSLIVPISGRDAAYTALRKAWEIRGWPVRLK